MSVVPLPSTGPGSDTAGARALAFEQPLNERMRTFMRLEFLFEQLSHHASGTHLWDTRAAVATLLEVIAILNKGDVRTEVLKELERHAVLLTRLRTREGVDPQRATNILESLERIRKRVDTPERQLAHALRESEFLANIRNRAAIPGGTCTFDLPAVHFWLSQPAADRTRDLATWLDQVDPLRRALKLILMLTRESAMPTDHVAAHGLFQMNLDGGLPHQLVRVLVPPELRVFPEISAGKHRFTIRFLERPNLEERAHQTAHDVPFRLVLCQF